MPTTIENEPGIGGGTGPGPGMTGSGSAAAAIGSTREGARGAAGGGPALKSSIGLPANPISAAAIAIAKAEATARGVWRVQLGAFSTRGAAEGLFRKLSGNAALAGQQPYYVAAGKITRLQAGPFESRATASAACAKLAPQPCFAVEAR